MKTETYEVKVITYADGVRSEEWRQNGKLHRTDGPACVYTYTNGEREEYWFQNGKLHRTDGPACVYTYTNGDRSDEWYHDGVKIDPPKEEEEPCAGRVVNIDGREYRLEPVIGEDK